MTKLHPLSGVSRSAHLRVCALALVAITTLGSCGETDSTDTALAVAAEHEVAKHLAESEARLAEWASEPDSAGLQPAIQQLKVLAPEALVVDATLPYMDQVEAHARIVATLEDALSDALQRKDLARQHSADKDAFHEYLAAEEDADNARKLLVPYAIAQEQANALQEEGYLVERVASASDYTGTVCNEGDCAQVDPIVALFFFLAGAFGDELDQEQPFGPNNDLMKLLERPLGGPNSELVRIREALLFQDKNGEIARLVRDPVKRPVEIVQSIRDGIIPPSDNGELAKIVRDPIKCTIGHLFGSCR